jgi:hypothetical protein
MAAILTQRRRVRREFVSAPAEGFPSASMRGARIEASAIARRPFSTFDICG